MPVHWGRDAYGTFYRYNKDGKKYHYTAGNNEARKKAKKKAEKQMIAIKASKNKK